MKPWFSRPGFWRRDPRVTALRSNLGLVLTGLANLLFESIVGWCAETQSLTISQATVEQEARAWGISATCTTKLVDALVKSELLRAEPTTKAYALVDEEMIGRVRQAAEEDAEAPSSRRSRHAAYRKENAEEVKSKDRARKAARKAARNGTDSAHTDGAERRGTARNGAESAEGVAETSRNGDPLPSQTLPTPARKQAQTQARNPPPPPAGGTEPEQGGGQGSVSEAKGETQPDLKTSPAPDAEAAAVAEPDVAIEPVDPESQSAKVLARLKTYTRAYAEGISLATGKPSPPTMPLSDMRALGAAASCAVDGAGKLLRGEALLAWFREQARLYATVRADGAHFERGFAPIKFFEWLRAGASTTKVSPGQTSRARGQQIVPQPADPGPFQPSFAPMTLDDLRAEKARQKEAAAAKAAGRLP